LWFAEFVHEPPKSVSGHDSRCEIAQMFITPRLYGLSQVPDKGVRHDIHSSFGSVTGWKHSVNDYHYAAEMLLLHQIGSVHVGQVAR
jgi:hypothetical protein